MNYKSKAITLTYSKQGESSIICKIFTEQQGLQTFIIKGVRSSKSKKKLGLFQALQLVKINATYSEKRGLQYLSEISVDEPIANEKVNMHKNFIAVFIAEITAKVLQENEQNIPLFNFIWNTKRELYLTDNLSDNFVLLFMLNLSKHLGFYPSIDNVNATYFNLETAEFSNDSLNLNIYLDKEKSTILKSLLQGKEVKIEQKIKSELLKDIMQFFHLNHYNLQNITSHLIIESLRV
jgi:DNA repair protein RecO (recombination protein O)